MSKYLADTSFLSALFNKRDVNHSKAKKISKDILEEYLIIPAIVIAELSGLRKNRKLRELVLENSIHMASEIPSFGEHNIMEYLSFRDLHEDNLKTFDSIILFLAINRNSKLLSFDKELNKKYEKISENLF